VKYSALRNQVAALRALIPAGLTIRILGGLPPDHATKPAPPPGGDLKAQAAAFRRRAPSAPGADTSPDTSGTSDTGADESPAAARGAKRA
jgi:hypothetical protein